MTNLERRVSGPSTPAEAIVDRDVDAVALSTALQTAPHEQIDRHLGPGLRFQLGSDATTIVELYPQLVRVTLPDAQLATRRTPAEVTPDGVIFRSPGHGSLSIGSRGDVLFQYSPSRPPQGDTDADQESAPVPALSAPALPPPGPETAAKPTSERYVGHLGAVRTHRTKRGQLVAEVDLTVPDPDRPGASQLVKCVAFGARAEALERDYAPGQEVTAIGIAHDLQRRGSKGQEWTERQVYLVRLPKPRGD